jgi:uncharacterized protein YciI
MGRKTSELLLCETTSGLALFCRLLKFICFAYFFIFIVAKNSFCMKRIFFTLIYKPGINWEQGKPIAVQKLHEHRQYHQHLLEQNKIIIGGAYLDNDEGLNILNVSNIDEAKTIAENDPAVIDKILTAEVKSFFAVFKSKSDAVLDLDNGIPQMPKQ